MTLLLERPIETNADTLAPSPPVERPRITKPSGRPWKRIIVDSLLLITFIASLASLGLGSIIFHAVAGLSFALAGLAHISLNRKWVKGVWRRRTTLKGRTRTNVIVDTTLAIGWIGITVSGLAAWAGVFPVLAAIHGAITPPLLIATVVHLALHMKWIKRAARGS